MKKVIRWLTEPISGNGTPPRWMHYFVIVMTAEIIIASIKQLLK